MKPLFTLNRDDVTWQWRGLRVSAGRRRSRVSAAVDTSSCQLILKHRPTGIEIQGEVPAGHYSNTQMQQEKEKLWTSLHAQLLQSVAKHLRIPGR